MSMQSIVTTHLGPVRGQILDGVHTFLGLRYGKDTGPRRFLPPEEPEPWTDVANAFQYGPMAPQHDPRHPVDRSTNAINRMIGLTDNFPESEDCLVLNVWTPRTGADADGAPVMIWVHSGGFATNSGSAPSTDGARLAREHGVVVVSFNHRLGPLGFLQVTDDPESPYATSGNVGMLDVVAVLQWARRNIAAFGGDPGNVTLFGQSGGAMKISTLLAMPSAHGLFHRAILQSGATTAVRSAALAREVGSELYAASGIADGDAAALAALPLEDLMIAAQDLMARRGLAAAAPVVDGRVIPAPPHKPGSVTADVPLIIGDLDTECALFLGGSAAALRPRTDAEIRARIAAVAGEEAADALVSGGGGAPPPAQGGGPSFGRS
ncbi:carboxylesterase family protein, partial [Brachybacterium sp. J144]|uniref:carboxylesterase family protein n=1 Tax=Brachybacterium sp. J144 TaxID=3116487 RepID=UPI002E778B0F